MSDAFKAMITRVRDDYVRGYAAWLAEQIKAHPNGSGEHLYEIQGQTNFARKLARVDFALSDGDNAQRLTFASKRLVGFAPTEGEVDGLMVRLSPFRWEDAVVEIPGAIWDIAKTTNWFNKWFGFVGPTPAVSPRGRPGEHIHICAWTEPGQLRIDFGSAPVLAVLELIALAKECGAQSVEIRDVSFVPPSGEGQ
jgi:hypothetical protein